MGRACGWRPRHGNAFSGPSARRAERVSGRPRLTAPPHRPASPPRLTAPPHRPRLTALVPLRPARCIRPRPVLSGSVPPGPARSGPARSGPVAEGGRLSGCPAVRPYGCSAGAGRPPAPGRPGGWTHDGHRVAVRLPYESRDVGGRRTRGHGDEPWQFDERGLTTRREASIHDIPVEEHERRVHGPLPEAERGSPLSLRQGFSRVRA
ncbi:DUF1348 family protein [Streptomyces sp. NPDC017202]|uniref:DUF1348 family protein n=1 Tax=Streptomyces sp. NPDC017202 TaxID=3364981 RepID=UPI0037BA49D4